MEFPAPCGCNPAGRGRGQGDASNSDRKSSCQDFSRFFSGEAETPLAPGLTTFAVGPPVMAPSITMVAAAPTVFYSLLVYACCCLRG